jgi:hypothetical protein
MKKSNKNYWFYKDGLNCLGTFYAASNLSIGPLAVAAGDRIGVRTAQASDPSAADITQLYHIHPNFLIFNAYALKIILL